MGKVKMRRQEEMKRMSDEMNGKEIIEDKG